jgi:hypothetical protein
MNLPLVQSDIFFVTKYTHNPPTRGRGRCLRNVFRWRIRVRTDQRWDDGVGVATEKPGSNAMAIRSLAVASYGSCKSPMGARLEATHDGGGSQPVERHGLAAEVLKIIRRRETMYGGFLENYSRTHHSSRSGDSLDPCVLPTPPLVGTMLSKGRLMKCA